MKSDLDSLMQAQAIDALLVVGPTQHNPPMYYLTGGGHVGSAILIKKRGGEPLLFYNSMERDEAAKSGLPTRDLGDYKLPELLKTSNGDLLKAVVLRYEKIFTELGLTSGRVALMGKIDAGTAFATFTGVQKAMPGLEFTGHMDDSLLVQAMATKDSGEVERIRRMGQITTQVVDLVADFLTSQRVKNETLVKADGSPVTVGEVRKRINLWLAERGAENPEGTIFAIGRDAGVPHSSGNPDDQLTLGRTIVFDIYPCEEGGGYFYDFTRTWCLGYATDEALELYEDVRTAYTQMLAEYRLGALCPDLQKRTCQFFEQRGHPTIHSDAQTRNGYVHSLGHGVGLNIHERPRFGRQVAPADTLAAGTVVTLEPGLYYPDRGLGVRLEDTVWMRPDGAAEVLADYPLDLVLPVGK